MSSANRTSPLIAGLMLAALLALEVAPLPAASVERDFDPDADFSAFHTFAWKESPHTRLVARRNSLSDKRIRAAVESALEGRGFRRAEGHPDFFVTYQAGVRNRLQVTEYGYGRPRWWGRDVRVRSYRQGTLVVDVIDAESDQLVWRGAVSDALPTTRDPDKRQKKLDKAVAKLFKEFPPE